jgi:mono/diheme cytochrome c family protein
MNTRCAYSHVIIAALAMTLVFSLVCVWGQDAATPSKTTEVTATNPENGRRLFIKVGCYECHGTQGEGSGAGPRLGPVPISLKAFTSYVRSPAREMPPYTAKVLSDQELADIHAFLQTRPHPPAANTIPLLK